MAGEWVEKVYYPQAPAVTNVEMVSLCEETPFARLGTPIKMVRSILSQFSSCIRNVKS